MIWLTFVVSAALTVLAATKLAEYADVIAVRTALGGMFIGTLLLAGATSLPELLTTINSIAQGEPDLAAGSIFGSNMFNMAMLAVLDLVYRQARVLRRVATTHALTASLASLLIALSLLALLADVDLTLGWMGWDSLLIIAAYVGGVRLIQNRAGIALGAEEPPEALPSLRHASVGFMLAAGGLVAIAPVLVRSGVDIAQVTGLSTGFVGTLLLAMVTSLPEAVTTIAACRIEAYDLAVGNLFGSNVFNMFALGLTDGFYLDGRFLSAVDPAFALAAVLGLLLTMLALIGNLAQVERRVLFLEVDALLLLICYVLGMWLLYSRGIGL